MVEPEGPHFSTISAGDPLMVNCSGQEGREKMAAAKAAVGLRKQSVSTTF